MTGNEKYTMREPSAAGITLWKDPYTPASSKNVDILGPFRRIPNIRYFKISVGPNDPLFESHGLKKRLAPKKRFALYTNGNMNRYFEHEYSRLSKVSSDKVF